MIGASLVLIGFGASPLQLSNPTWQLQLFSLLLTNSNPLLIGSILVCLGAFLGQDRPSLLSQARVLRVCASWLSLLFFIGVPWQFFAAIGSAQSRYAEGMTALRSIKSTILKIQATKSEQEFRFLIGSLPDAPRLPSQLNDAFPIVRQRLAEELTYRVKRAESQLLSEKNAALQGGWALTARNGASLILFGLGFSWVALSDPGQRTVIRSLVMFAAGFRKQRMKGRGDKRLSDVVHPGWIDENSQR